jgi:23S rRNA (guanosine2251-2'-O)-methyltransferase
MKAKSPHEREIWMSGYNPVKEALHSQSVAIRELIVTRKDPRAAELVVMAKERGITVRQETFDALSALVGNTHHQGVALLSEEFRYTSLEKFLECTIEERQPLLILDSVQDPQNMGALIRTACFLGLKGMIIPKDRSASITGTVIKIASGAAAYLPIIQVINLAQTLQQLKDAGLWIIGMDVEGDQTLYEVDLELPLALVVGNEQKGLRPLIRKTCDFLVRIPATGPLQSLNAATAGAIAMAEVQRQQLVARKQASSRRAPYQS